MVEDEVIRGVPYPTFTLVVLAIIAVAVVVCVGVRHAALSDLKYELTSQCEERRRTLVENLTDYERERCTGEIAKSLEGHEKLEKQVFQYILASVIHQLQPKLDVETVGKIAGAIITESRVRGLDPVLMTALIYEESRFNPLAISKKGAIGLMQVVYETWKKDPILKSNGVSGKDRLYHININIKCGTDIFAQYYKESDRDIVRTLNRYHSGNTTVSSRTKYYEIDYVNKVLIRAYKILEKIKEASIEAE